MRFSSPAFANNQYIPTQFTCDGDNINPPLDIADVPEQTLSLTLIMHDPDAPVGDFLHWTAWNINPDLTEIPENWTPPPGAIQGLTDFGRSGYGGPCPPSGIHRYFFELYALDAALEISRESKRLEIEQAMKRHVLAQTQLIGLYTHIK